MYLRAYSSANIEGVQEKLFKYFKSSNNRFKNSKGMELGLTEGNNICTYFSLWNHDYGPLANNISTEDDNVTEFIDGFKLMTIEDINDLDYTSPWMRCLNGNAEIGFTPIELDATLTFRIIKRKSIIYSLDLHFYDEAYELLTLPEDFEKYISSHENRFQLAEQNRYKMNRR